MTPYKEDLHTKAAVISAPRQSKDQHPPQGLATTENSPAYFHRRSQLVAGVLVIRNVLCVLILCMTFPATAYTNPSAGIIFSTFESGSGPRFEDGIYRLLDDAKTLGQANAVAFPTPQEGAFERMRLQARLRVERGAEGGSLLFLNTDEFGSRGPAPFLKNWVEPNLSQTFAVGFDVHNTTDDNSFSPDGNYQGFPEREISLHWDGREIVKRLVPGEFRGQFVDLMIWVKHVIGGAEISVQIAGIPVYENFFIAGMSPYEARLAIGAETGEKMATTFDVKDPVFDLVEPAQKRRLPSHFELFNHVMTGDVDSPATTTLELPPADWAYARVVLTLEIHDAGEHWDSWDRNGSLYVVTDNGRKYDIAPFVTSFRTPWLWRVDVTHFRPWLAGSTTFEIATGSEPKSAKGFMLSASLDFYHGTPEQTAYRIVPLWSGTAKYLSAQNHFRDFFPPRQVAIDEDAQSARLFMTTTGHSQVGEFTPSERRLIFIPDIHANPPQKISFNDLLWKTDVYLNPNRPQSGTWKYARAGWAPGDIVRPWWIDLTDQIAPGHVSEVRYEPQPYDFSSLPMDQQPAQEEVNRAALRVRAYLILYHQPQGWIPAPVLKVLEVVAGSNAQQAGIEAGDYLLKYDQFRPDTIEALRHVRDTAEKAGKKSVVMVISRAGKRLVKKINTGKMGVLLEEQ